MDYNVTEEFDLIKENIEKIESDIKLMQRVINNLEVHLSEVKVKVGLREYSPL